MAASTSSTPQPQLSFVGSLVSGAVAGTSVDCTLYPLDTIKTRLQSQAGFFRAGGFRHVYAGLTSVLVGSAPGAALFFATYESVKHQLGGPVAFTHLTAACAGEVMACLVRVPTEVVKQRAQAPTSRKRTSFEVARKVARDEGLVGFYRGFRITVLREIPFAMIQYPLWESLKHLWSTRQECEVNPLQSALCGSAAGIVSAALTTPLDVAKTRIMLAHRAHGYARGKMWPVLVDIYEVDGIRGLYKGVLPRSAAMGLGGFIFFGAYETAKLLWLRVVYGADAVHSQPLWQTLTTISRLFTGQYSNIRTFDDAIDETRRMERSDAYKQLTRKDVFGR